MLSKTDLKTPKGTRDFYGQDYRNREILVNVCVESFKIYNVEGMETPCFELTDNLKKGDDDCETLKQTFDLINDSKPDSETDLIESKPDSGESERCTLRYDQTMPFARFTRQNKIIKMRRFQIGQVFRKDQPNMSAARYRQFLQCDYDNVGDADQNTTYADAETIVMLIHILDKMDLNYTDVIHINTIQLLRDMFTYCQIEPVLFTSVCRCLDKLLKQGWDNVKKELLSININEQNVDKIKLCLDEVLQIGNEISKLKQIYWISNETQQYLEKLYVYFDVIIGITQIKDRINIDLSLARGLDYYTGLIFEVRMQTTQATQAMQATSELCNIGSVAAGGRYDELCGDNTKCIGFSLGIDRLLPFVKQQPKKDYAVKVWVIQLSGSNDNNETNDALFMYKIWIVQQLREHGISCGTSDKLESAGTGPQMRYVLKNEIPFIIFIGIDEYKNETVKLKNVNAKTQNELTLVDAIKSIR